MSARYRLCRWPDGAGDQPERPSPIDRAAALLARQRHWRTALGPHRDMAADTARDILLSLFVADGDGRGLSMADLTAAVGVPAAVLTRWVAALQQNGLATRSGGGADIQLTPAGQATLMDYLEEV